MSTQSIANDIAAALEAAGINATNSLTASKPATPCQYCGKPLSASELAALAEAGLSDPADMMCDACAEGPSNAINAINEETLVTMPDGTVYYLTVCDAEGPSNAINEETLVSVGLGKEIESQPGISVTEPMPNVGLGKDQAARIRELELQIAIERARKEHAELSKTVTPVAKKAVAATTVAQKPAAEKSVSRETETVKPHIPDELLVEIVKALRMPVAVEGKFAGSKVTPTIGKLVYSALYQHFGQDPIGRARTQQLIDSALERKVLSRRTSAKGMLLLFDYAEMPNPAAVGKAISLPVSVQAKLAALFAAK